MLNFRVDNKVAIVTGCNKGIGLAIAQALAESGADIIGVSSKMKESGQEVEKVVTDAGRKFYAYNADFTNRESLYQFITDVQKDHPRIDILINNAAINDMFENPALAAEQSAFENYPVDMFRASLEVNVTGMFLCCQVIGTAMAKAGQGSIVNVASTYGMVGPDQSIYVNPEGQQTFYKSAAYPATKGAVINFTRFLAAYWGNKGVRVNTLSPGGVENGQADWFIQNYSAKTTLGRMAAPTDYMGAVVFLASEASAYMSGANLVVDGGWTAM
jgi:NAD(P)-dependent dehydrogenase (short-subunit alcohol dehydrogenase family)